MPESVILSSSPAATGRLGAALGKLLRAGDLVLLVGPYGAGKTCFTRGLARGAGVRDLRQVTSPTYVLMNVYAGRVRLAHLDCHRLSAAEIVDLGLGDALEAGAAVIEWGDRVPPRLAPGFVTVDFAIAGRTSRRLSFSGRGRRGREVLSALRSSACLAPRRRI